MNGINLFRFTVRVLINGYWREVKVTIRGRHRDDAALNVPSEVCHVLGREISSRYMRIIEG